MEITCRDCAYDSQDSRFWDTALVIFMFNCGLDQNIVAYINKYNLILSGREDGARSRAAPRANGQAGERRTGALGVWWHHVTGEPPSGHSHHPICSAPPPQLPLALLAVQRGPRRCDQWGRPHVKVLLVKTFLQIMNSTVCSPVPRLVQCTGQNWLKPC